MRVNLETDCQFLKRAIMAHTVNLTFNGLAVEDYISLVIWTLNDTDILNLKGKKKKDLVIKIILSNLIEA